VTYEEFARTRLPALLRYAVMLTGDPHTAADIVQDTMVRAHLKWRRVSAAQSPEAYVRQMVTNAFLDWRGGSWLRRVVLRDRPVEPPPVADPAQQSAERDRIWRLLAGLPRRQRAVLVLRYYEDLADADIAEMLGCTVGTVRGYASRALATLRTSVQSVHAYGGSDDRG
jgi:RNA polymerase sigma-70 factor (sigma-E family)